jgi:hypothetical protein
MKKGLIVAFAVRCRFLAATPNSKVVRVGPVFINRSTKAACWMNQIIVTVWIAQKLPVADAAPI